MIYLLYFSASLISNRRTCVTAPTGNTLPDDAYTINAPHSFGVFGLGFNSTVTSSNTYLGAGSSDSSNRKMPASLCSGTTLNVKRQIEKKFAEELLVRGGSTIQKTRPMGSQVIMFQVLKLYMQ